MIFSDLFKRSLCPVYNNIARVSRRQGDGRRIGILANSRLDGRFLGDKTNRTSNAMSEEQKLTNTIRRDATIVRQAVCIYTCYNMNIIVHRGCITLLPSGLQQSLPERHVVLQKITRIPLLFNIIPRYRSKTRGSVNMRQSRENHSLLLSTTSALKKITFGNRIVGSSSEDS